MKSARLFYSSSSIVDVWLQHFETVRVDVLTSFPGKLRPRLEYRYLYHIHPYESFGGQRNIDQFIVQNRLHFLMAISILLCNA